MDGGLDILSMEQKIWSVGTLWCVLGLSLDSENPLAVLLAISLDRLPEDHFGFVDEIIGVADELQLRFTLTVSSRFVSPATTGPPLARSRVYRQVDAWDGVYNRPYFGSSSSRNGRRTHSHIERPVTSDSDSVSEALREGGAQHRGGGIRSIHAICLIAKGILCIDIVVV